MNWRRILAGVLAMVVVLGGGVALVGGAVQAGPPPPKPGNSGGGGSVPSPVGSSKGVPSPPGNVVPLTEGFENGLDAFTSFSIGCSTTHCLWGSVTTDHHTGLRSAFGPDVAEVGDDNLVLVNGLAIPPSASSATLTFWQKYGFEASGQNFYDGGVLEVSTDGGTTWVDAGANITTGGYNGTIVSGFMNPLAGRAGWGGSTGAWTQVQVNLLPYRGFGLDFRLRLGTDSSNGSLGWWADDMQVSYTAPLAYCAATWGQTTAYPTGTRGAAVVALNGLLYSFGGQTTQPTSAAYRYDPTSPGWTPIAALPAPRLDAEAVTDGTSIYILGGSYNNQAVNTLWRYDPAGNSYTTLAPFTTAAAGPGAATLNGKIYRISGESDVQNGTATATVEVYTIASNTWAALANYPTPGFGLGVLAQGGYLYTAGGAGYLGFSAKTYRYDPAAGTWDDGPIADLPTPMGRMGAALYNGRWLLAPAGGYYSAGAAAWDPATNVWSSLDQMPVAVNDSQGAVVGGSFYLVGGGTTGAPTTAVQVYTETACVGPSPTPPPAGTPTVTPCPIQFSDVPSSDPFYAYIRCLACRGIVSGYTGSPPCAVAPCFLGGNVVTRGQMAKFVSNAAGYSDAIPSTQQTFTDVAYGSPFWLYVERAVAHGVISGYTSSPPCTTGVPCFLPGNAVTRGQTAKFVSQAAGYADAIPSTQQTFTDVPPSNPFWLYTERAVLHAVIAGYTSSPPCTTGTPCFLPGNAVTRGQTSKFIANAFYPSCQTP